MKKLQIFISSTWEDLKEERQAAVETILKMEHIPAGMELFAEENQEQMKAIEKWIADSDIFLLVLGGRYGTVNKETRKSYIHMELEYAKSIKKPIMICVMKEVFVKQKKRKADDYLLDKYDEHLDDYKKFKDDITRTSLVTYFGSIYELKEQIYATLNKMQRDANLVGWVKGSSIQSYDNALYTGLNRICLSNEHENMSHAIETASIIELMFNSAVTFLHRYENSIIKAICKGCELKVLLSNPHSTIFTSQEEEFVDIHRAYNYSLDTMEIISKSLFFLRRFKDADKNNKVTLKYMRCFATCSLIFIDDEICHITPYLPYKGSQQTISFQFVKNDTDFYMRLKESFNDSWDNAGSSQ